MSLCLCLRFTNRSLHRVDYSTALFCRWNLASLNTFLEDINNIKLLCVGGRLANAEIPITAKFPLLLLKSDAFVSPFIKLSYWPQSASSSDTTTILDSRLSVSSLPRRNWVYPLHKLWAKIADTNYGAVIKGSGSTFRNNRNRFWRSNTNLFKNPKETSLHVIYCRFCVFCN